MTVIISKFWRDLAAGKPLFAAWRRKDVEIALESLEFDDVPMQAWLQVDDREQRRLLRAAVAVEA